MLKIQLGYDLFAVDGPPPLHATVDEWIANARRSFGDLNAIEYVTGPGFGFAGGAVLIAKVAGNKHLVVTINPNNGVPLGKFIWEDTYISSILRFHVRLVAPLPWRSWGQDTIAWIGGALIVSIATGLYLWWPPDRGWRSALTLKRAARGRRRLHNLHNVLAVCLFIPLLIIVFTGVYLIRPDWIDPAVTLVSVARTPDPEALARISKPGSCGSRTTPGQAVALAQARFSSAKFASISIPEKQELPYLVQLAPPNNVGDRGQTRVFVDRECPIILTAIDGEVSVAAETFQAIMHPLHQTLMLGRIGQGIAFLAALLLPVSFVTGLVLWLGKRKDRTRT